MGFILELRKKIGSRPVIMAGAGVILLNEKKRDTSRQAHRQRLLGLSRRLNGNWRKL